MYLPQVDGDIRGNATSDDSDAGETHSPGSHGTPERTQEDPRKLVVCEEHVAGSQGSSPVGMVCCVVGIPDGS